MFGPLRRRASSDSLAVATTLLAVFLLAGCEGGGTDAGAWAGTVDTLHDGRIVVDNPAEGRWGPDDRWALVEELRIGSAMAEGPELFGAIRGLAVGEDGTIHVLDQQANEVRRFGPDGAHLGTTGRAGSGPGEFAEPIGATLGPDGSVWVIDPRNARYTVLSPDGEYVGSHIRQLTSSTVPWNGGFGPDGRFHERYFTFGADGPRHGMIRMDSAVAPADTFWFPEYNAGQRTVSSERSRASVMIPFAPSQFILWEPRGYLWAAVSGEYAIHQLSMDGDTLRTIRKPAGERARVTSEEKDAALERLEWFREQGGRIRASEIPDEKPIFNWFDVAPDGHVWVRLVGPDDADEVVYDVFDPEGFYLGDVRAPTGWSDPVFSHDAVTGVIRDSLGVQSVVRWRIERGEVPPADG